MSAAVQLNDHGRTVNTHTDEQPPVMPIQYIGDEPADQPLIEPFSIPAWLLYALASVFLIALCTVTGLFATLAWIGGRF